MKEIRLKVEIAQLELSDLFSGEGGIRTHGGPKPTTVFETVPFNHSGTFPGSITCQAQGSRDLDSGEIISQISTLECSSG